MYSFPVYSFLSLLQAKLAHNPIDVYFVCMFQIILRFKICFPETNTHQLKIKGRKVNCEYPRVRMRAEAKGGVIYPRPWGAIQSELWLSFLAGNPKTFPLFVRALYAAIAFGCLGLYEFYICMYVFGVIWSAAKCKLWWRGICLLYTSDAADE